MSFAQFVEWAFMGIMSGAVVWSVKFLGDISHSIQDLNVKITVVLERVDWHEKEIDDLSGRVKRIENGPLARYDA